jgi:hypothetical protein
MVEVFIGLNEDFEVPASLMGLCIRGPLTGDEQSEGHETRHDRWKHLQLLLQPPKKVEANLLARCIKGGRTRTELPVCIHEQCTRSVHPCAGRGLRFVQIVAKAPVVRLRLRSMLEGKASLGARSLSLRAGLVSVLLLHGQPMAK